jgi:hypothetical protein
MASKISLFLNFDNHNSKKPIPTANCKSSIEFEDKVVSDLKVHLDYSYHHAISCKNLKICFSGQTELFY